MKRIIILFFLAFQASTSYAAYTYVQTSMVSGTVNGLGGGFGGSSVTAGNLLVSIIHVNSNSDVITSISDDKGNTWTRASISPDISGGERVYIYYAYNVAAGVTGVTLSVSGGSAYRNNLIEFSGSSTSDPLDQTGTNSGTPSSNPSVTLTGNAANDLLVGGLTTFSSASTEGGSFTQVSNGNTWYYESAEYLLDSGSSGSKTVDWTASSQNWTAAAASFKLPSVATVAPQSMMLIFQ